MIWTAPNRECQLPILHYRAHDYGRSLVSRAIDWPKRNATLKLAIDQAINRTASLTHYFWSGRVLPAQSENDSVKDLALTIAQAKGGTTLEGTLNGVRMPRFDGGDPDAVDIWQYASTTYTTKSRGEVFVVKGESLRSGNVWEVFVSQLNSHSNVIEPDSNASCCRSTRN